MNRKWEKCRRHPKKIRKYEYECEQMQNLVKYAKEREESENMKKMEKTSKIQKK